jgi:hypothetical protein
MRPYLEKTLHKKGLVEWLKAWVLSPGSSTLIKKKKIVHPVLFSQFS